jgi:hypothetical protein
MFLNIGADVFFGVSIQQQNGTEDGFNAITRN